MQLVQIFTCCSHNASASLAQGVTPLFHLGLATTSSLHYLSLQIFVTFGLPPPSLWVAFEFSHFWTPALSILLLFSYTSHLWAPSSWRHQTFYLVSIPMRSQTCLTYLALSLRFSHLFLIHYALTFAEDHFGLSRPFLSLTRSHISSLWSLSLDLVEGEIHKSGCRQNQPIIRSGKIQLVIIWWWTQDSFAF